MKQLLQKILIYFFLCWICLNSSAQVYLDYAKIHINIKPMGGYNIEQIPNGDYFVVENIPHYQADLDPDDENIVQVHTSYLSGGLYVAKYDKNGKYITHTFLTSSQQVPKVVDIACNDSFFMLMCKGGDSILLDGAKGTMGYLKGGGTYIVKYNNNLELINSFGLQSDSCNFAQIKLESDGNLFILCGNTGTVNIKLNDSLLHIEANNKTRSPNTADVIILSIDKDYNYIKHSTFGIKGGEAISEMETDAFGNLFLWGYLSLRDTSYILGDTIPRSSNYGYGTQPVILKFNADLVLMDYYINNLLTPYEMIMVSNGNILLICNAQLTSQLTGLSFVLLDSNLTEKLRVGSNAFGSGNTALGRPYCFETKTGDFGMAIGGPLLFLKDTTISLQDASLLVLSKDSLHFISRHFINPPIKKVFHIDSQNILSTIEFTGELSFQNGSSNGPPFTIGDRLYPTQNTAIVNHTFDCTPVTTHLQYDTQSNCADQYGMQVGRGNVRLISQGSGASFQWYNVYKPTFKLSDQESPIQGGQYWKGTKTSFFQYGGGSNTFFSTQYSAQVGGSCTEPYWSDTATQIIWGAPIMVAKESSKNVTQGSSDSIEAYLQDKNYPIDSIEFQWYRGATAIIEGLRFQGARTPKLFINNIKDYDQGIFTCVATRIHCRDYNKVLGSSTFLNVKITGTKDIENSSISIYPNPCNSYLKVQSTLSNQIQKIEIYDAVGRLQKVVSSDFDIINVQDLSTGLFTLKIITDTQVYSTQFIKN